MTLKYSFFVFKEYKDVNKTFDLHLTLMNFDLVFDLHSSNYFMNCTALYKILC